MQSLLLIRYGEIALKGKNRPFFEKKLLKNIKEALRGLEPFNVIFQRGRYFVKISPQDNYAAIQKLQKVFGIVSISPVLAVPLEMEAICRQALLLLQEQYGRPGLTFKVATRRANKRFPHTSPEVNRIVGEILLNSGLETKVDVHNPDIVINIEIREKEAYLFCRSLPGSGGLPVGVTGRGLLLLSGGIDSPVAGWMALKRGVKIEVLHFHSPPYTGEGAINKVLELCRVLTAYGGKINLHLAPFGEIQQQIRRHCPEPLLITLMRRAMFRLAERLAQQRELGVIYTGESLGQVASQTLENLTVINSVVTMPVLRPLIGFDKEEITARAREIGTYAVSIRPFEDCCTLFVPPHPVTRPDSAILEAAEEKIPLDELVNRSLDNLETRIIANTPGGEP
ncbi:MAG: tRNA uracil 4-sulfurtransferase ThiI [Bacillota bacterium]